MIVARRAEQKTWEGKSYVQNVISISDGEQTFQWSFRDDSPDKPLNVPAVFTPITLRVKRATTEKGIITVGGVLL